jgi:hypothetical protein
VGGGVAVPSGDTARHYASVKVCEGFSGQAPQIQVCQAFNAIPKKPRGGNCCQRCFNNVLSKGSEYLCKCDIFILNKFTNISKNLVLLCHYGVLCVD